MDRLSLKAQEREVLGKKVKTLRREGILPAHVFGNKVDTEHVSVPMKEFMLIYNQAGETGLIDLKIGDEKVRPVLIREVQYDPVKGLPLHIDFYQVNLKEKVTVPVPIVLVGEEPESVHMGETIVLQNLSEVEVEALPTDLVENIEVNIESLKNVDDAITVADLNYNRETLTILVEPEEVVVKLAPAVSEEMQALLEEQEAEAEAALEAQSETEGEGEAETTEDGEGSDETTEDGESVAEAGSETENSDGSDKE